MKRTSLKRKPAQRSHRKRDWAEARAKVTEERPCRLWRLGDCSGPLEAAHVIGRALDAYDLTRERHGFKVWKVEPVRIVPMCKAHHGAYDRHELDLLPYLTLAEQGQAVIDAGGIEAAQWRVTGERKVSTVDTA